MSGTKHQPPITRRKLLTGCGRAAFGLGVASFVRSDASETSGEKLIVCGWDEVFLLPVSGAQVGPGKLWSWKAAGRPELPETLWNSFRTTDDCKPLDGGRRILITSSSGGIAIVERPSGKVTFHAEASNAHSAELLPGGRIVVAVSVNEHGNRLILFDENESARELFTTELYSGHGVVWDERRGLLWALGGKELRCYGLDRWYTPVPSLRLRKSYRLPDPGGHDLQPAAGTDLLNVSTGSRCWRFDRDTGEFHPHPDLAESGRVKCISDHPTTGRTVYIQAEGENWWAEHLHFLHPGGSVRLAGEHLYKARWLV